MNIVITAAAGTISRSLTRFMLWFLCTVLYALPVLAQDRGLHGRIGVTKDGHYLQYADGTPFFWLGDTGWQLFHKLKKEEILHYLDNRKKKGFNVIQATILDEQPNRYGDRSMRDGDPLRPVESYFELVDWVIREAMKRNMVMALLPTWGDKVTAIRTNKPALFNIENAYAYGMFLGRRYGKYSNIIWIAGGDNPAFVDSADWRPVFRSMIKGLREGSGDNQLITYHPWGENSATLYWHEENVLDLYMMQSGHRVRDIPAWDWVQRDRAYLPTKPVLDGEPNYEDHPVNWEKDSGYFRDYDVRKAMYRSVFAGACGVTYGHQAIHQFYMPADKHPFAYPDRYWTEAMDRPGAVQSGYLKKLMMTIAVNRRIPDQSIIAGGQGEKGSYIVAFRGDDSGYAMVYMPVGKAVTIDMSVLKGDMVDVSWYDPAMGTVVRNVVVKRKGHMEFTSPTTGIGNDWVLIVRSVGR